VRELRDEQRERLGGIIAREILAEVGL
jgi:hypothetical protein